MNPKFFDVNKDKQDNIINAALRIFAVKGYKDASTDVIVKEAGISKGLLFHYFESKKGLYEFICDYSSKYMILELTRSVKSREKDFFNVISQIEAGKTRVLRNYPYMQQFLRSLSYEKDPEAIAQFGESLSNLETAYNNIYAQINPNKFFDSTDYKKVIEIINWINDGYVKSSLQKGVTSADEMNEGFNEYLNLLKKHFYKSDNDISISVAKEEDLERNESVMDDLKMEMTFEERLMAGKRPLVDLPEGEEVTDTSEEKNDESAETTDADKEDVAETKINDGEGNATEENTGAVDSSEETAEEFFDDEDEGDVMPEGVPKVSKGEVLKFPTSGSSGRSTYVSANINDIIQEAESNLDKRDN